MQLSSISKAIAGFLGGALVAWLSRRGIFIEEQYREAIVLLLGGGITAVIVYLSPKNTE